MKLTDERIREMFDAWFDPDDNGNYWYCFLDAYRMAEAEATKPCVCCEPSTPGVVHRTGGPCYVQEATKPQITGGETYPDSTEADKERLSLALDKIWGKKPQEPVGYQELFDAIAAATSVACSPGINISIEDFTAKIGPLYATPQPCPKCREWENKYLMEQAVNAGDGVLLSENERLKAKCAELEAELLNKEGMTCGDCNDTGWLENREEGRYPCTCMTEAEPYQILQAKCAELEQDLQTTADALAENEESEKAWEMLDTERVRYLNDVGDVLGQNNTDESLIDAAKRAMTTIEFQKKAWEADFVRMTRMEAAIERMRIAGGKDEFQKAFDDAKGLL